MKKYLKIVILFVLMVFSEYSWGESLSIKDLALNMLKESLKTDKNNTVISEPSADFDPDMYAREDSFSISNSALNMLKESFKTDKSNTVISGLSVDFAADMLANGATGTSLDQLTKFFGVSIEDKNEELQRKLKNLPNTLEISNSIWGNSFKESFKTLLENTLDVSANPLPNNTSVINAWISEKTHHKIPAVLEEKPTNPYDLYLVNTVYFKDKWLNKFKKGMTEEEDFYSISGEIKKVLMMHKTEEILYAQNNKLQSIKLPYKYSGYMVVFLPAYNISFEEFMSDLALSDLDLRYIPRKVVLSLPKFKIDKETDIKELFQSLGVNEIFKENNTDLAAMTHLKRGVMNIMQRAIIEIEEEGTTATAATVVRRVATGRTPSREEPIIYFTADRPFLFFVSQGDFIGIYTGKGK